MKVAILGYGTVGSGVYEVLKMNADYIAQGVGEHLEIKYVLDLRDFPGQDVEKVLTHDFNDIVNDPEVRVVAEVMGGEHPAYEFSKAALEAGKSVCTSNKELVSKHGAELLRIAREHKCSYFFEASVGGGIPIIRPLNNALTADEILEIRGIVNGTTNYILTRMRDVGMDFDEALAEAQANGYAERNPAADIEGLDAARKTSILASLANRTQIDCEDIYTEGITKITAADIAYAKKLKANIKLLSLTKREAGKTYAMVAPVMIRSNSQLYFINGVFNAIMVKGNAVGDLMFYGSGAGKLPTASAVVADMIQAAKHKGVTVDTIWDEKKLKPEPKDAMRFRFFIRVPAEEADKANKAFGIGEVVDAGIPAEYGFVTDYIREADFEELSKDLHVINRIRCDFKYK